MDIKQLKTFLTVADSRSFLKAAETMYVSRQAIAKTIDSLEEELKTELFFRNQKGAMMTPAGIYFYPRAAAVVAEFDKLKKDSENLRNAYKPKINIYMSIGIYDYYAASVYKYEQDHKNEMIISTRCCLEEDVSEVLSERKADAILSFKKPSQSLGISLIVGETDIDLLASKELKNLGIADISKQPKLLYDGGTGSPLWWDLEPGSEDIISSDLNYLYALLKDCKGIMPMPEISIPKFLDFAEVLNKAPKTKTKKIYFSTLEQNHYNALNFMLINDIYKNVLLKNK